MLLSLVVAKAPFRLGGNTEATQEQHGRYNWLKPPLMDRLKIFFPLESAGSSPAVPTRGLIYQRGGAEES